MRAALLSPTVVLVAAPFVAGCTGTVGTANGAGGGDAETTVTHAVLLVERTIDTTEGARAAASARFARVATGSSAGDTLRAIGAALDLPARGSCASIRPTELAGGSAEPVPVVELLDVGRVSVETAGAVTPLVPRQLPYVTDVVTGTVYARAAEPAVLPAGASYVVHVGGTRDFASFDVVAAAPDDPERRRDRAGGLPGKIVASDKTLDFSWPWPVDPVGPRSEAGDLIYVEAQPAGVRCTLGDGSRQALGSVADGTDRIARGSISSSFLGDESPTGSVIVHRLHSEALQVRGVDDGELRFDFARVVTYVRQ